MFHCNHKRAYVLWLLRTRKYARGVRGIVDRSQLDAGRLGNLFSAMLARLRVDSIAGTVLSSIRVIYAPEKVFYHGTGLE